MRVLDIGCGWGGAAKFAAERYGVEVLGVTVSEEQVRLGKEVCRDLPVEIRLQDYRSLTGTFDRIFSLGMFEHVGYKNYGTFFRVVRKLPQGRRIIPAAHHRRQSAPFPATIPGSTAISFPIP